MAGRCNWQTIAWRRKKLALKEEKKRKTANAFHVLRNRLSRSLENSYLLFCCCCCCGFLCQSMPKMRKSVFFYFLCFRQFLHFIQSIAAHGLKTWCFLPFELTQMYKISIYSHFYQGSSFILYLLNFSINTSYYTISKWFYFIIFLCFSFIFYAT